MASVLLSASVERFDVFRKRDLLLAFGEGVWEGSISAWLKADEHCNLKIKLAPGPIL